ncbi:MAG: CDP-glucose 4,6-dehydratase [Methanobrevibacter sp.]|jgi:CDP-glucose 4,6-dehydratase|nr:CDP-glucose 4,6-dehydratase [Candidatus Methanovirga basalitermitum]
MFYKLNNFFKNKKVLITGHTGFKGSWLVSCLLNMGAEITGFSNGIPTNPSMFRVLSLGSEIDHVIGDIRDFSILNDLINKVKPEIVIHLAAQPLVRQSYLEPVETYQTNVMGTVNLLEAIRNYSQTNPNKLAVLNVTSDKCYENKEINYSYKESDPLGGYDPYSSSKACSEIVTSAYRRSFFNGENVSIATARAGNVIGGGDWSKDRLVVDCINALVDNRKIVLRNPEALRPWQHVLEAVHGYLTLIYHMVENNLSNIDFNSSWNFGPYDFSVCSVESLVKMVIETWGGGSYKIESKDDFHEAILLQLDISKALKYLNWKPVLTLEESVDFTVDWYKNFYNGNEMLNFTIEQISKYFNKCPDKK